MKPLDEIIDENFVLRLSRGEPWAFEGQLEDVNGNVEPLAGRTFFACVMAADGTRLREAVAEIYTDSTGVFYRGVIDGSMSDDLFGQSNLLWWQGERTDAGNKPDAQGLLVIYPGPGMAAPVGPNGLATVATRFIRRATETGRARLRKAQAGARGPSPWDAEGETLEAYNARVAQGAIDLASQHVGDAILDLGEAFAQQAAAVDETLAGAAIDKRPRVDALQTFSTEEKAVGRANVEAMWNKWRADALAASDRPTVEKLGDHISVRDWAAKGDGVVDDTAAFLAALTFAKSKGTNVAGGRTYRPKIYIPSGVYRISWYAFLELSQNNSVEIQGAGKYATKLRVDMPPDGAAVFMLGAFNAAPASSFEGTAHNVAIRDLTIINDDQATLWATRSKATSATASTIADSTKAFAANSLVGCNVVVSEGTGKGQLRTISANTATTITVSADWGTIPDATSEYAVSLPARRGVAIMDNGSGNLTLSNVQIRGFKYGILCSSGSDYNRWHNVDVADCDIGVYMGPGCQQLDLIGFNVTRCRIGLVLDAVMQGRFQSWWFTGNERDILFEATNTTSTRAGLTGDAQTLQKNYTNRLVFSDPWFETGSGGLPMPFDTTSHIHSTGTGIGTSHVIFERPIVISGTKGMPNKKAGQTYSFLSVDLGNYIEVRNPLYQAGRIDRQVDNYNTLSFPRIYIVDPAFFANDYTRGFSRPDALNIAIIYSSPDRVTRDRLALGHDPIRVGNLKQFAKQSAAAKASQTFALQIDPGQSFVTISADLASYAGGIGRTYMVTHDLAPGAVAVLQQIGADIPKGAVGPTSLGVTLDASGILRVTPTFGAAVNMVVAVSQSLIGLPVASV